MPHNMKAAAELAPIVTARFPREIADLLRVFSSKDSARANLDKVYIWPGGHAFATDGHRLAMVRPCGGPAWDNQAEWSNPTGGIVRQDVQTLTRVAKKGEIIAIEAPHEPTRTDSVLASCVVFPAEEEPSGSVHVTIHRDCAPPPVHRVVPSRQDSKATPRIGMDPVLLAEIARAMSRVTNFVDIHCFGDNSPYCITGTTGEHDILTVLMPHRHDDTGVL